eukprot:PLAT3614.2.p1 GENE.PLAT3614.2~~PLAT3614.2.p1  ORF type:complete len:1715 (-),score=1014.72 PLAT3614.2:126-5015(-)
MDETGALATAAAADQAVRADCMLLLLRLLRFFQVGAMALSRPAALAGVSLVRQRSTGRLASSATTAADAAVPDDLLALLQEEADLPDGRHVSLAEVVQSTVDAQALADKLVDIMREGVSSTLGSHDRLPALLRAAVGLWLALQLLDDDLFPLFSDADGSAQLVMALLLHGSDLVRKDFAHAVLQLCEARRAAGPYDFFLQLLTTQVRAVLDGSSDAPCQQFCQLLNALICADDGRLSEEAGEQLLQTMLQLFETKAPIEVAPLGGKVQAVDRSLIGIMSVLGALVASSSAFQSSASSLVETLVTRYLLALPSADGPDAALPLCKSSEARQAAYSLLAQLCAGHVDNQAALMAQLQPMLEELPAAAGWSFDPAADAKSSSGYVGLRNLGATCYMNALLQQFYNIPELRNGVLAADAGDEQPEDSVIYQLQLMFSHLSLGLRKAYNPLPFTQAYKDAEGRPTNVMVQMDAQEFLSVLCDRLESRLKATRQHDLLRRVFGGSLCNQLICKGGCDAVRESREDCYFISLQVQNKRTLQESLEAYVDSDVLDDYRCSSCEAKVETHKRVCLETLPNVLIMHLKRFEFNFESFLREKVDSELKFDMEINLEPFTKEGLQWRDAKREAADGDAVDAAAPAGAGAAAGGGGDGGDAAGEGGVSEEKDGGDGEGDGDSAAAASAAGGPYQVHPEEYYQYELVGVVVHVGTAEYGHYYSHIRDGKAQRWLRFDDTTISPFDSSTAADAWFGGAATDDGAVSSDDLDMDFAGVALNMASKSLEKSHSAYMLVYRKKFPQFLPASDPPAEEADGGDGEEAAAAAAADERAEAAEELSTGDGVSVAPAPAGQPLQPEALLAEAVGIADVSVSLAADGSDGTAKGGQPADDDAGSSAKSAAVADAEAMLAAAMADGDDDAEEEAEQAAEPAVADAVDAAALTPALVPEGMRALVWADSLSFLHSGQVYDPQFFTFMAELLASAVPVEDDTLLDSPVLSAGQSFLPRPGHQLLYVGTRFALDVLVHSAHGDAFPAVMASLTELYEADVPACQSLLEGVLASPASVVDVLLKCPRARDRVALQKLLMAAIRRLQPLERAVYDEVVQLSESEVSARVEALAAMTDPASRRIETAVMEDGMLTTRPRALVLRFMDLLIAQIDGVHTHWPRFSQYFQLFSDFAMLGWKERYFLIDRRVISRLVDLLLGQGSPLATVDTSRTEVGSLMTTPPLDSLFSCLSLLVRSCTSGKETESAPPTSLLGPDRSLLAIHYMDKKCVRSRLLFDAAFKDSHNPRAVADILCHWSWQWREFSVCTAELLLEALRFATTADVPALFEVMEPFLALEDDLQLTRIDMLLFSGVKMEPGVSSVQLGLLDMLFKKYSTQRSLTVACIGRLMRLVAGNDKVMQLMAEVRASWIWMQLFLERLLEQARSPVSMLVMAEADVEDALVSFMEVTVAMNEAFGEVDTSELLRTLDPDGLLTAVEQYTETSNEVTVRIVEPSPDTRVWLASNAKKQVVYFTLRLSGDNIVPDRECSELSIVLEPGVRDERLVSCTRRREDVEWQYTFKWDFTVTRKPPVEDVGEGLSVMGTALPLSMFTDGYVPLSSSHAGGSDSDNDGDQEEWSCSACTFLNKGYYSSCDMCSTPRD